jgi:hypothetical protein
LLDDGGKLRAAEVSVSLDLLGAEMRSSGEITREAAVVGEGLTGRLLFASLATSKGLRPGDFVTVNITEPALNWVARLPATAVSGNNQVLVIGEDGRLSEADIALVRRQGDDVLVRSRELSGAQIVAERSPLLGAGIKVRVLRAEGEAPPAEPDTIALDPERRAKLIAFVEANKRMPKQVKARLLAQLQEPEVRKEVVERLEGRMGG